MPDAIDCRNKIWAGAKWFVLILFLLGLACSEARKIKIEPTGRIVLAELFTFARCVYCPYAEHALDLLSEEFGDSLAVLAYHRRVMGDTISPAYVAVRESLYQITVSPTVIFDGTTTVQTEDPDQDYAVYKDWIINKRNFEPRLRMKLEADMVMSQCHVTITIISVDSIFDGDYRLLVALYEDSVYFYQAGAPETTFYYVVRALYPDAYGIPLQPVYPDSISKEFYLSIQPAWKIDKIGLVAFVQNVRTREILQAIVKKRVTN